MTKEFTAGIYRYLGGTLLGPPDELRLDDKNVEFVAAILPLQPVDPAGKYMYVVDATETYSVSKTTVKLVEKVVITWKRPKYSTANQEKAIMVKAMRDFMQQFEPTSGHYK